MSPEEDRARSADDALETIDVRMSIRPSGESDCPPPDRESSSVRQSFYFGNGGMQGCQMVISEDGDSEYRTVDPCDACPCFVLSTQDCVAELLEIRDGRLIYSVTIPDRSKLAPLVENLRETGATVSVNRILAGDTADDDPSTLTETQRETLIKAIEAGYYDQPRKATLDDIAEHFDITASAASQRLNSVTRRLVREYKHKVDSGTRK